MKDIKIYTDGSCDNKIKTNPLKAGGYGVALYYGDQEIEVRSEMFIHTTSSRMEIRAMMLALEFCVPDSEESDLLFQDKIITIYSDSQYVVKGINSWMRGWNKKNWEGVKNDDLWRVIHKHWSKCDQVIVKWVKGHNGTEGNERADKLANDAYKQAKKLGKTPMVKLCQKTIK